MRAQNSNIYIEKIIENLTHLLYIIQFLIKKGKKSEVKKMKLISLKKL